MKIFFILFQAFLLCLISMGAKPQIVKKLNIRNKEVKITELRLRKEINNKKLSSLRKFTLAILAAREMQQLQDQKSAISFYQMARAIKIDENKNEINIALSSKIRTFDHLFYFEANIDSLIKEGSIERALLSLNPDRLKDPENAKLRIIYDLLNVKIKMHSVKNLYCNQDYQKDPESYYQYPNLICAFLIDYLRNGKMGANHVKIIEEYFLKHDLKEMYLLNLVKEINTP